MYYFDHAATSFPKPDLVGQAMVRFLATSAGNPGRSGHRFAVAAERVIGQARLSLSRLIGADDPQRMIMTCNGTDALNMAIKGVVTAMIACGEKPHVVTTELEHNSVSRPLEHLRESGCLDLTRVAMRDDGRVHASDIALAMTSATRLIVMTHGSNVIGTVMDVASVGELARQRGVLLCVDASQTIGVVAIDIELMGIDLLAFAGHKALQGPPGTGGLYVGTRCPDAGEFGSWREGGTGGDSASVTQPKQWPFALESGTPNTVGIAGLLAGVEWVRSRGIESIAAHESKLIMAMDAGLRGIAGVCVYGSGNIMGKNLGGIPGVGVLSFTVGGYESADVASILDDSFGIAVRAGLHCSPYVHRRLGTFGQGAVRASVGPMSTMDEVNALVGAVSEIVGS